MNHIVLEQGTIVDRIDYNLESAVVNTAKAKKELHSVLFHYFSQWLNNFSQ